MGDFESNIVYLRAGRSLRDFQLSCCANCGTHLQTYCERCSSMYSDYDTLYECGKCGTPKNLYCSYCKYPQTLEHIYYVEDSNGF